MTNYDVIIIHPPAIYDFRKKTLFPGVLGSSVEQVQFNKVPIGMLSLAEYLDRHGYKVIVDNIGDRMINSTIFDVKKYIKNLSASIFSIGLSFQQHAQGALEIAKMCKKLHPNSLVVLGGLTATRFHQEIINKYEFVDAVIRAEAEKPFVYLLQALEKNDKLVDTPNLTYRTKTGDIRSTPLMPASTDLDEFEYTRFDLIQPKTSIFPTGAPPRWSLEVCRGCVYNCAICGGSAYTYKTYLGMNRPAFRSPGKIVADVKKLTEQGVYSIGLYQDSRMGGEKYWRSLLAGLYKERAEIERLSLDLLVPANEEFIKTAAQIGRQIVMHICPDTGSEPVRRKLGRHYSNEQLIKTVRLCRKYDLPVTSFFSIGLAGEKQENVKETWDLWRQLSGLEPQGALKGLTLDSNSVIFPGGPIVGPIVLDPGSLAFDNPQKYGYKLLYKSLEEYIKGLSQPSWHQWLNYETELMNKEAMLDLILSTVAFSIDQREESGIYDEHQAASERLTNTLERVLIKEIDQITKIKNKKERESALAALKIKHDLFLQTNVKK
jgi:B12-binding domain/radical SAM domain protein